MEKRADPTPPPIALRKDLMTLAPNPGYQSPTPSPTPSRPERRGVSRKTVIEAAKQAVPTIELAELLCGADKIRKVGERWVARCPLPNHEDRTPSFTVYAETNSWFCFGACLKGGDVVDLAAAAWGYGRGEMAMAAADLLHEFGHEIPERPPSWYRRQDRQKPVRDAINRTRFDHLRRRLFRRFFEPSLVRIEDPYEREAEAALLWDATTLLAEMMLERLRGGSS
jgi:DNA primase